MGESSSERVRDERTGTEHGQGSKDKDRTVFPPVHRGHCGDITQDNHGKPKGGPSRDRGRWTARARAGTTSMGQGSYFFSSSSEETHCGDIKQTNHGETPRLDRLATDERKAG